MKRVSNLFTLALIGLISVSCTQKKNDVEEVTSSIIPGSVEDFNQNVSNTVYFGFDRYNLITEAEDVLRQVAAWLNMYKFTSVTVQGHTDKRGTKEYNIGLGGRRAESVKKFLVANGVDDGRISTISYGKEMLIADGDSEQDHALNRRAHVVVVGK
ncbi:MAG: OmpA family protein [Holosporales bacterium]|jgi:peptidoglycan-associated lipoprotein|nr:OmpA family protein [Holosporales bacterium]